MEKIQDKIKTLERQGVKILAPHTVHIGQEVDLSQVQGPDTVLHPGTNLQGARLKISSGARIGTETPATVSNCALGRDVELSGGYFADAVFLDQVKMGSGSHVRGGTLMEEQANGAHTVGLKQTILMPFVTLGSLINFCDVLMAGGTSRRDHSEVGSSFIHFNFTPFGQSGDKATASLVGDVPRGVMLRSPRIFMGGQGGLVGPVNIDFGAVLAAGFVYRRDHGPDQLVVGEELRPVTMPFSPLRYNRIRKKVEKNLRYLGNLVALWHWYDRVRLGAMAQDPDQQVLYRRAQEVVESGVKERTRRLGQIAGYMEASMAQLGSAAQGERADQRAFAEQWTEVQQSLLGQYQSMGGANEHLDRLLEGLQKSSSTADQISYVETIQGLDDAVAGAGTQWLAGIVDQVLGLINWS